MLKNLMKTIKGGKRLPARDPFTSLPPAAPWPSLDLDEDDKEVRVKVEAPGLSEKDLRITYADGVLSIAGEKREEKEEDRKGVHYRESRYGSFIRSVPIGGGVDWERAKARYKRGVLEVAIPRKAGAGAGRKLIHVD